MARDKRLCRRSSRDKDQPDDMNYHSQRAYQKGKARRKEQKKGRKAARRGR